jgi:hypothetical protein
MTGKRVTVLGFMACAFALAGIAHAQPPGYPAITSWKSNWVGNRIGETVSYRVCGAASSYTFRIREVELGAGTAMAPIFRRVTSVSGCASGAAHWLFRPDYSGDSFRIYVSVKINGIWRTVSRQHYFGE